MYSWFIGSYTSGFGLCPVGGLPIHTHSAAGAVGEGNYLKAASFSCQLGSGLRTFTYTSRYVPLTTSL